MPQIVCAACAAVNRISAERPADQAKCGRCHKPLFSGQPIEVDGSQLLKHRSSTQGTALLLDVWAPWCGPCKAMAPHFAAAAPKLEPEVRLLKLNSDAEPEAAQRLGVSGIPALFLFRDGQEIGRTAGAMSAEQLVAWTRKTLAA
jgi:thioredoxin 2